MKGSDWLSEKDWRPVEIFLVSRVKVLLRGVVGFYDDGAVRGSSNIGVLAQIGIALSRMEMRSRRRRRLHMSLANATDNSQFPGTVFGQMGSDVEAELDRWRLNKPCNPMCYQLLADVAAIAFLTTGRRL